jgi:hypothetical protein
LAADGAHIAIFDINLDGAKKVAQELNDTYKMRRAIAVPISRGRPVLASSVRFISMLM